MADHRWTRRDFVASGAAAAAAAAVGVQGAYTVAAGNACCADTSKILNRTTYQWLKDWEYV